MQVTPASRDPHSTLNTLNPCLPQPGAHTLAFTWWGTCTLMSWHRNSTLQQQWGGKAMVGTRREVRACPAYRRRAGAPAAARCRRGWEHQPPSTAMEQVDVEQTTRHCRRGALGALARWRFTAHTLPKTADPAQPPCCHSSGIEGSRGRVWTVSVAHPPAGVVAVHGAGQLRLRGVPLLRGLEGDVRRGVVHQGEGACAQRGRGCSRARLSVMQREATWCTRVKVPVAAAAAAARQAMRAAQAMMNRSLIQKW